MAGLSQRLRGLPFLAGFCAGSLISLLSVLLYSQATGDFGSLIGWSTSSQPPPWYPAPEGLCERDPFSQPGMIYWGQEPRDTRWVPFPIPPNTYGFGSPGFRTRPLEELAAAAKAGGDQIPGWQLDGLGASERLMSELVEGGGNWTRGRNVLFVGDSHDRNNIGSFCEIVGGVHDAWGLHQGGVCRVERLELTIVYWFLYGLPDKDYTWHVPDEPRPLAPEKRITQAILPRMAQAGLEGFKPDLVVLNSLFWDSDHLFEKYFAEFGIDRPREGGLSYPEVQWYQSRAASLILHIRRLYGHTTPMMYRARHLRASNEGGRMLRVTQLDQGWRAVCQGMRVRIFDWGGKLEGYTEFYDGNQHFPAGPVTWLFGDMMLYYLREAIDRDRWWACMPY